MSRSSKPFSCYLVGRYMEGLCVLFYRLTFSCIAAFTLTYFTGLPAWSLEAQTPTLATVEPKGKHVKESSLHVIDLTQPISSRTPTYEGTTDEYRYEKLASVQKNGYFAGAMRIPEHFGTRVDAPAHFVDGGMTVDKLPPERLILPAVVIDVREEAAKNPDYELTMSKIDDFESQGRITPGCAVLLL